MSKEKNEIVTSKLEENTINEINAIAEKFNEIEETSIEIAIRISELVEGKERKAVGLIYDEFQKILDVKRSTLSTLKKAGDAYRNYSSLLDVPYTKVALIPSEAEISDELIEDIHNKSQREIKDYFSDSEPNEPNEPSKVKTYSTNALIKVLKRIVKDADNDNLQAQYKIAGKMLNIDSEVVYFE